MVSRIVPTLIVTGPVGVGKTTVSQCIIDLLDAQGQSAALIDMDALRACVPHPTDDPFHLSLGYRNLAAISSNFLQIGTERLVIADVVESPDLSAYRHAIPNALIAVVRLTAQPQTIRRRLTQRETAESLPWYLARAVELTAIMERQAIGDFLIDTDDKVPVAIAECILQQIGWLPNGRQD